MEHVININDVMAEVKITFTLKGAKEYALRLKLAEFFINVARFILPKKIKIDVKTE